MAQIFATDRDGTKHEIEARDRSTLMEILKQAGLSIEALCSGCCQCATCHVFDVRRKFPVIIDAAFPDWNISDITAALDKGIN